MGKIRINDVNSVMNWYLDGCPEVMSTESLREVGTSAKIVVKKPSKRVTYTFNGVTGSLTKLCKEFGISYAKASKKIKEGMTIEDAFAELVFSSKSSKVYEFNGRTGTLKELCNEFDIKYSTAYNKLRKGKSIEEVIHEGLKLSIKKKNATINERNGLYTYGGITAALKPLCEAHGLHYNTVKNRMNSGMSLEQAFEYKNKPKTFTVKGVTGTLEELAEHFNVKMSLVNQRLYRGLSIEEALEPSIDDRIYSLDGFEGNLGKICIHFKVNYNSVRANLMRGSSIGEAVEFARAKYGVI